MRIQRSVITDPTLLVRGPHQALTGVRTEAGVATVLRPTALPETVRRGDLYLQTGQNQVLRLSLSEDGSRAQLLSALLGEIDALEPEDISARRMLTEVYTRIASGEDGVPDSSALAARVADLRARLAELDSVAAAAPAGPVTAPGPVTPAAQAPVPNPVPHPPVSQTDSAVSAPPVTASSPVTQSQAAVVRPEPSPIEPTPVTPYQLRPEDRQIFASIQAGVAAHNEVLVKTLRDLGADSEQIMRAIEMMLDGTASGAFEGFGRLVTILARDQGPRAVFDALRPVLAPVADLLAPAGGRLARFNRLSANPQLQGLGQILRLTFLDPDPAKSLSRIRQIAVLLRPDEASPPEQARALYEVLHEYGPTMFSMLPQRAQTQLRNLANDFGNQALRRLGSLLPAAENADFAKALLKYLSASNGVTRTAASIDLVAAMARTVGRDNRTFRLVAEFLKMNGRVEDHWRVVMGFGGQTVTDGTRMAALHELGQHYQVRGIELALSVRALDFSQAQLSRMGVGSSDEALALIRALGLNNPRIYAELTQAATGGSERLLEVLSEQVAGLSERLGTHSGGETLRLMALLGPQAPAETLREQAGMASPRFHAGEAAADLLRRLGLSGRPLSEIEPLFARLGVKNGAEALALIEGLGVDNLDGVLALNTRLGRDAAGVVQLFEQLGAKNSDEALAAARRFGFESVTQAGEMLQRLGNPSLADWSSFRGRYASELRAPDLLRQLDQLGVRTLPEAERLLLDMGATRVQDAFTLMNRLAAASGREALASLREMRLPDARAAIDFLGGLRDIDPAQLRQTLGAASVPEAFAQLRRLGLTNLPALRIRLRELAEFGVRSGAEAVVLLDRLGLDDLSRVPRTMRELNVANRFEAHALLNRLGAGNAGEGLATLRQLGMRGMSFADVNDLLTRASIRGPLTPETIGKLHGFISGLGSSGLAAALEDMRALNFRSVDHALQAIPRLGITPPRELWQVMHRFGMNSVDEAIAAADLLHQRNFKAASDLMMRFGPFHTGTITSRLDRLNLTGMRPQQVLDALTAFGLGHSPEDLARADSILIARHAGSAREAWDLMRFTGSASLTDLDALFNAGGPLAGSRIDRAEASLRRFGDNLTSAQANLRSLGCDSLAEGEQLLSRLGVDAAQDALRLMNRFQTTRPERIFEIMDRLHARNASQVLELMDAMRVDTVAQVLTHFDRLGVESAEQGTRLLRELRQPISAVINGLGITGAQNAKEYRDILRLLGTEGNHFEARRIARELGADSPRHAMELMHTIRATTVAQARDIMSRMGVTSLPAAAVQATGRMRLLGELAASKGLDARAVEALQRCLRGLDEARAAEAIRQLGRLDARQLRDAALVLQHVNQDIARLIFTRSDFGVNLVSRVGQLCEHMKRLGVSIAEVAPRLASGLGKMIPAAGAYFSGKDTIRLGLIAAYGNDGEGKDYDDPDVRMLALIAAGVNAGDTLLGLSEVLGIGNVALLANLGIGVVEMGLDALIEHYNRHPMPQEMRTALRAAARTIQLTAPSTSLAGFGINLLLRRIYPTQLQ